MKTGTRGRAPRVQGGASLGSAGWGRRVSRVFCIMLLSLGLGLLLYCVPRPAPTAPTPIPLQLTTLPTTAPPAPIIVITPEPGRTPVADPKLFLQITVQDRQRAPVVATIRVEFPDTGGFFEIGPTPAELLPIPVDGEPFVVVVTAPGYLPVRQEFQVTATADTDYEWVAVLRALPPTPTPLPEA